MVPSDHRVVGSCPLPLLVGVEHENDIRTFVQEIVKLGHVICPLKVGVTYLVAGTSPPLAAVIADGQQQIRRLAEGSLSARNQYVREDPATEYLYLLGVESRMRECEWFGLTFTAAAGPGTAAWFPLPQPG
jgi:hypothetical protein